MHLFSVIVRSRTTESMQALVNSTYYKCDACGRAYINPKSLSSHKLNECGKEPRFQCVVCLRRFHQKNNLTRHLRTVHRDMFVPS